jgi:hypothetical protein
MENILHINIEMKKYKRKFRKIKRYYKYIPPVFNNLKGKIEKQTGK